MESKARDYMKEKIISNIIFSMIEKFFLVGSQFVVSLLLIRLLPREEYGIIGIVVGYFTFIHIPKGKILVQK